MTEQQTTDKRLLRDRLKEIRANIVARVEKDKRIRQSVLQLAEPYKKVFTYVSIGSEVDTVGIIKKLFEEKSVSVPQVSAQNDMHAMLLTGIENLRFADVKGNIPMRQCVPQDGQADIIIVPLLGFNACLHRIGYGAGCYDRYFAKYPNGIKVGLAYEEQFCDFLPSAHDIPLDVIVIPNRIIRREK